MGYDSHQSTSELRSFRLSATARRYGASFRLTRVSSGQWRVGLIGGERVDALLIGFFAENITELLRSPSKAEPKLIPDGRTDDALLSAALREDWVI